MVVGTCRRASDGIINYGSSMSRSCRAACRDAERLGCGVSRIWRRRLLVHTGISASERLDDLNPAWHVRFLAAGVYPAAWKLDLLAPSSFWL
jgi:hypothetical protein